ncbi:MAG: DNA adenine methylase [Oscillospiraceae bacterium]
MDSFISWIGGKKLLRKELLSHMPTSNIGRYIEVFGGAAWLLFAKDKHAALEVYNDFDSELVNLFRCVKYHLAELERCILPLNSRELFEDIKARSAVRGRTDIQRAADFFMLIRISFGSDRGSFGCAKKGLLRSIERIEEIHNRLISVVIEHKSYENLIKVYDRPDALFYCDPPYVGTENYYPVGFTREDHAALNAILSTIKGRFMLSYNDDAYVRNLYKNYNIYEVERSNNLSNKSENKRYKELIITNY